MFRIAESFWIVRLVTVVVLLSAAGCSGTASKPKMPVQITFRQAALGQGYVLQLKNESTRHLAVAVVLENKTLNERQEGYLEIAPAGQTEHGWLQGWKFVSGETITLSHEDYQDLQARVP